MAIPSHLVLVGLPGAGKTTVGLLLAERLKVDFMDFDEELERRTGMAVAEIFDARGEPFFRDLEHALTNEVAGRGPMVLSPGGGWIANPASVALLRPPARIIHLRVGVEAAVGRLGTKVAARPLLRVSNPRKALAGLWERRRSLYETADLEIDTESLTPQEVADKIGQLATSMGWPVG
jgi:shikimate kinase